MPNINVIRRGIQFGFATNLGSGLGGISTRKNLSRSLALPIFITRIVGTPQMVFTNPIMTIHVNRTTNQPLMNSMVVGGYINTNVTNLRGAY